MESFKANYWTPTNTDLKELAWESLTFLVVHCYIKFNDVLEIIGQHCDGNPAKFDEFIN